MPEQTYTWEDVVEAHRDGISLGKSIELLDNALSSARQSFESGKLKTHIQHAQYVYGFALEISKKYSLEISSKELRKLKEQLGREKRRLEKMAAEEIRFTV